MKWPLSICHLKPGGQFHYELPQSLDFLETWPAPLPATQALVELRMVQLLLHQGGHGWNGRITTYYKKHPDPSICATLCLILQGYMNIFKYIYICDYMSDEIPMP